jgi:hypothetical protein
MSLSCVSGPTNLPVHSVFCLKPRVGRGFLGFWNMKGKRRMSARSGTDSGRIKDGARTEDEVVEEDGAGRVSGAR